MYFVDGQVQLYVDICYFAWIQDDTFKITCYSNLCQKKREVMNVSLKLNLNDIYLDIVQD